MVKISYENRYCRFLQREVVIQIKEKTDPSILIPKTICVCRTAREGNMAACRVVRCKLINGGRGASP